MLSSYKKREGYHHTYTIGDFYNDYKKENSLPRKTYIKILTRFLELLKEEIIVNKHEFRFPGRIGTIKIKKLRNLSVTNRHKIDWKKTKETKIRTYHLNLHTDRCYFRWVWQRDLKLKYANFGYYKFRPVRKAARHLAKHILACARNPEVRDYDVK